jgi:hypothetical protein
MVESLSSDFWLEILCSRLISLCSCWEGCGEEVWLLALLSPRQKSLHLPPLLPVPANPKVRTLAVSQIVYIKEVYEWRESSLEWWLGFDVLYENRLKTCLLQTWGRGCRTCQAVFWVSRSYASAEGHRCSLYTLISSSSLAKQSLRFGKIATAFHFFEFRNNNSFTEQGR